MMYAVRLIGIVIGIVIGVCVAAGGLRPAAASYQPQAETRFGWGYDSNVFEKVRASRHLGESFFRLEAELALESHGTRENQRAREAYWPRLWRVRYATDLYWRTASESRHILHTTAQWRLGSARAPVTVAWETTWRAHRSDEVRGYLRHQAAVGGGFRWGTRWTGSWRLRGFDLETPEDGTIARRGAFGRAGLERPLLGRLRAGFELGAGRMRYDERAIASPGTTDDGLLEAKHTNTEWWVGLRIEHLALPRAGLAYRLRGVNSNSFGYDQSRHEWEITWGSRLSGRWTMLLAGRYEKPLYAEDDYRLYRLREDPDDPDLGARSGVVAALSRPVAPGWTGELRLGYERNESRMTGRYYEKVTAALGLRYRTESGD